MVAAVARPRPRRRQARSIPRSGSSSSIRSGTTSSTSAATRWLRETADFDRIWVGTETRDYADKRWGGTSQYEAYFIMRWLGGIGGAKCGGGWYDSLRHHRAHLPRAGPADGAGRRPRVAALLLRRAAEATPARRTSRPCARTSPSCSPWPSRCARRDIVGVAAYKPANSHPENEKARVRLRRHAGPAAGALPRVPGEGAGGVLLRPRAEGPGLPDEARDVHRSRQAGAADRRPGAAVDRQGEPRRAERARPAGQGRSEVAAAAARKRNSTPCARPCCAPSATFRAPNRVALYLFRDGSWVVENFNDEAVTTELNGQVVTLAARGWQHHWNK